MYCSLDWDSAANRYLQRLDRQVPSVARLCPDQILAPLDHQRRLAGLCMNVVQGLLQLDELFVYGAIRCFS